MCSGEERKERAVGWMRVKRVGGVKKGEVGGVCFFFNDTATTEIYTLSLHDALPI